jgi:hypothetical protein
MADDAIDHAVGAAHRWRYKIFDMLVGTVLLLLTGQVLAHTSVPIDTTPPSVEYGALYRAVELSGIFPDSKRLC